MYIHNINCNINNEKAVKRNKAKQSRMSEIYYNKLFVINELRYLFHSAIFLTASLLFFSLIYQLLLFFLFSVKANYGK